MDWKDKRKQTSTRPSLNEMRVNVKNLDGEISFIYYDKDAEKNVSIGKKIEGVLLGKSLAIEGFDRTFGKNGGSYRTPYIFDVNNAVCYSPSGKKAKVGTYREVKDYITTEIGGNARTYQVLFILTNKGVMAVYTSISIAIDQLNKYEQNLTFNYIILKSEEYNKETSDVSAKAQKMMGKVADTNPPKFASISVGKEISDLWAKDNNLSDIIDLFEEYKNYYSSKASAVDNLSETEIDEELDKAVEQFNNTKPKTDALVEEGKDPDDLPF